MGMYSLIEDAMNRRFDELIASGLSEDEAVEAMREEEERRASRRDGPEPE